MQDPNSEHPTKKRLFVAIGLPSGIQEKLAECQNDLKRFARDAKWVRPEGIHLTLKFLGYVDPRRIEALVDHLKRAARDSDPFAIALAGYGFYPGPRRPSVLWVGVRSEPLIDLQNKVENSMADCGFERENRAFSPHLTLARFRSPKGLLPLGNAVAERGKEEVGTFTASDFELFESILRRDGAQYEVLHTFSLQGRK